MKVVVQAIPTFVMSCFKLSVGLCKDFDALVHRFWWGIPKDRREICWKASDLSCKAKEFGGLGFVILKSLIKLCWLSNCGGFMKGRILWLPKFSKLVITQIMMCGMRTWSLPWLWLEEYFGF